MIHCIPASPHRAQRRHAAFEFGPRLALVALAASVSCLPASDLDSYRSGHDAPETDQAAADRTPAALQNDVSHLDGSLPLADVSGPGHSLTPQSTATTPAKGDDSPDAPSRDHGSSTPRGATGMSADAGIGAEGNVTAPDCSGRGEIVDAARGVCYEFSAVAATWFVASAECPKWGGTLVTVDTQTVNDVLSAQLIADVWIGASDLGSEGTFSWEDGTPFSFENFKRGEPDNLFGIQDCALMRVGDGRWSDRDCRDVERYVCERPLAP
jgi:lectin-like protein